MTTPRKNLPEGGPAWLARQKQYHGDCDSDPRTRRTNTGNALGGGTTHYRARAPSPEPVDRTTEPEVATNEVCLCFAWHAWCPPTMSQRVALSLSVCGC